MPINTQPALNMRKYYYRHGLSRNENFIFYKVLVFANTNDLDFIF